MTLRTKQLAIISILSFTLAFSVLVAALIVVQSRGGALIAELELLREQEMTTQRLNSTFRILELSNDERQQLAGYFLAERYIISFISDLEERARREQVKFETTQLAVEPPADSGTATLKIGFSFSGTAPRVIRFMKLIESLPYHKNVVSAEIKQSTAGADSGQWQGNIIIHVTLIP